MRFSYWTCTALAVFATIAGCTPHTQLPVLTKDALFAAAKTCGAQEVEFSFSTDGSLPSFSYLDPGPFNTGKATPASQCLADALKGYRFESMTIRTKPEAPAGE